MADGPIDSLSIEIGASSTKAVNGIKKLTDALLSLKVAMKGEGGETFDKLKKFADAMNSLRDAGNIKLNSKLPDQLRNIGKAVSEVSDDTVRKLNEMTAAIDRLRGIDLKGFSSAVKAAQKASRQVNALQAVKNESPAGGLVDISKTTNWGFAGQTSDKEIADMFNRDFGAHTRSSTKTTSVLKSELTLIGKILKSNIGPAAKMFGNALKNAQKHVSRIAKSLLSAAGKTAKGIWDKTAFAGLEKSLGRIKNVINSFNRIAFYRAIRSAIKYVTDALKEGTENAYHYAREFGSATSYIADAYDRISSSNFKMSNQLGAAWATLIAYVEPIIVRIINLVTRAADAITQFFALMSGKGTYLKAVDYNKAWADSASGAAKAAEEWKNQLMGFDEINRLEEPSDGSGGSGSGGPTDYGNMFVESPVNDFFADIRDAFENGEWARLGTLLGEKFNEIVDMIDWKGYGKKIGEGLQATITVAYNFLKTADFKNLGARVSEFINNALNQVNFDQAGRTWMRLRLSLLDFLLGIVDGMNWRMLAIKLSNFVIGALDELAVWLQGLDPIEIANALIDFFGNIKYEEIAEKIKEVLKSALNIVGDVVAELLPEDLGPNFIDGIVNAIKDADFAAIHNVLMYKLDSAVFGEKWANFWWTRGDYAGKDLVMSMIKGMDVETSSLGTALTNDVENPTDKSLNNLKTITNSNLTTIQSDTSMALRGIKNEYSGLAMFIGGVFTGNWSQAWNGIVSIMSGSIQTIFGFLTSLIDGISAAISWIKGLFSHMNALANSNVAKIQADGSIYLQGFATGGFPEDGLFMANHGEMVGQFSNGRTAVANNEQIVAGISAGVFDAVVAAFAQSGGGSGGNDRPVNIYLDGKLIAQSTTKYQNQFARARG